MKYPIGIQSFKELREGGYVYVDKTDLIYKLTQSGKYFFLSRPRRFGKSLILSTLEAYFEGRKELFDGLAIAAIEKEWPVHPVIHVDLNTGLYTSIENLRQHLITQLSRLEERFGRNAKEVLISDRFAGVIRRAVAQTGRNVVVLIDEYDKPLLEAIGKPELQEVMRDELRAFYSVLKSCDKHIRFAMLTGVTKFGRLSVFSGLNNLYDLSFDTEYASICGITEKELKDTFCESITAMAEESECTFDEMVGKLRNMYDGYRFTQVKTLVYNPFSLLTAFKRKKLGQFWFETGTPKYLVELLQSNNYLLNNLEGTTSDESSLSAFNPDSGEGPIPVMYQSGYLTIKQYDDYDIILGFPNNEVRQGFAEYILPFYVDKPGAVSSFGYRVFMREIRQGQPEDFMRRLQALTADISYEIQVSCENDFQNLLFIVFSLASIKPTVERRTSDGRIDMVVETANYVYVMEYKFDGTAREAMDQINSKQYSLPWTADHRPVIKIGANFSTTERRLTEYLIEE
ncbi:MAG: AAA family ATPase [Muribaculaceae bacterium]|nr:AAA family ATPase [Muribaculaceae bacterium]MCF0214125.1 AAA family ATPase [Muribaculaceae bacterium]